MKPIEKLKSLSSLKFFFFVGGLLIIIGETADLIFSQQLDLWFQVVILILMAVLLIYTMNRR